MTTMITVITDSGSYQFDAKPEDITQSGSALKITQMGQTIATFRRWHTWLENNDTTGQE